MSFFEPLDPREEPERPLEHRQPVWAGAPENVLPASAALDVVLAATADVGVAICGARVYRDGLTFGLQLIRRTRPGRAEQHRPPLLFHGPREEGDPRFGVAFADGRKAVMDDGPWPSRPEAPEIHLAGAGGGGSDRRWEGRFWLWPLPPEGPLTFAFAWPAQGIAETTVEVDTAPLRAAASRARELWPDERPEPPSGSGWAAYG